MMTIKFSQKGGWISLFLIATVVLPTVVDSNSLDRMLLRQHQGLRALKVDNGDYSNSSSSGSSSSSSGGSSGGSTHKSPPKPKAKPKPSGGSSSSDKEYIGCLGYSTDKLSTKWTFNGKIQNCSYVHHSDSNGQNSGGSGDSDSSHGSNGSDEYYAKGSSTDDVFLTNEDFYDVYDNCTSSSNGCNYGENASGSGYYISKSNSKYNYSNYHNGNQTSGSQNSGNQTNYDQNGDVNSYAANGNVDGDDGSETADASGAGNDDGASGSDQNGQQDANSDYSEDVSTESYDPYGSFEISQCDTYEKLWIWDLALSCKNDEVLDTCQCKFASELMSQNMLSCNDISSCPTDCQVCNTCMQLLGCDDPTGFAALMKSPLFWILLVAGIIMCGLGCYLFYLRRRQDKEKEEKGYLNVGLMADDASSTSGSSNGRSRSPLLGSPLSSPDTTPPSSPIWLAPSIPPRNSTTNDVESNADTIDNLSTPTLEETRKGVWLAPISELSSARNIEDAKSTESTVEDTMDSTVAPTDYIVDNSDISMPDEGTTDVGLAPAMRYMDANESDAEKENEVNAVLPMKPEVESQTNADTDESANFALPADQNATMTDSDIAALCDTLEENESCVNQIESDAISSTESNHCESDGTFDCSTDAVTQSDATTSSQSNATTVEDLQNDVSESDTNVTTRFAW